MTSARRSSVQLLDGRRVLVEAVVARSMNVVVVSPAWMISRAIVFESAMSVPTWSPSQRSAHCAPTRAAGVDDEQLGPVVDALQDVVEEDRMRLAGVRAPEDDDVRVLDLLVRGGPAARSEDRGQTDHARGVSSAVAGVDVVRADDDADELLARKFISLVAFEHEKRPMASPPPATARRNLRRPVERLVPKTPNVARRFLGLPWMARSRRASRTRSTTR